MNAFFASVEQRANPSLLGKPIVVGGGIGKGTVVAAASYEAKAFGVKNGMSTWEAKKLCPDLIAVVGDMSKYVYTSKVMLKIFHDYSDIVEVFSIDEAFLDVSETQKHFRLRSSSFGGQVGGAISIAHKIKERLRKRFGLTCSVGIGPNKLLAKLAGELKKPDGLVQIDHDDIPELFDTLPVKELCGVGRKLEVYLGEMGIKTCGDLRRCPAWKLVKRFGEAWGESLYNMGQGNDDRPVISAYHEIPAKSMGHSYTLPKNISDIRIIKNYLLHLSEQVGRRLRRGGYKGKVLHLYIRYGDFTGFSKQKSLEDYIDDGYDIYTRAVNLLDEIDHKGRTIRFVGVSLSSLIKDIDQISVFESVESKKKALKAADEVNDKFGEFTVMRASLLNTELHEKIGMIAPRMYKKPGVVSF